MLTDIYEWAIIGAGPAGIAAVGKLIDAGIAAEKIIWIDPQFTVGDFGTKWHNVPSNTKVESFNEYLYTIAAFDYANREQQFALDDIDPSMTCYLRDMREPLQWITQKLLTQVHSLKSFVQELIMAKNHWQIKLAEQTIAANNVILAVGAEEKNLDYPQTTIALSSALNPELLARECSAEDTIAVFGASHSAILIIRNLLETCSVKQIINFYQSPLRFAIYFEDKILFDNTGLKGNTADWARENLHGTLPKKLSRLLATPDNIKQHLAVCNKAIYAVGFTPRTIPVRDFGNLKHNPQTGIIAPGLFGLGIAYPEIRIDEFGIEEARVGLRKFLHYLTKILPIWLHYPI